MLDGSIPTSEASLHSILISEVKDMFYKQCKHLFMGKITLNLVWRLNLNNF
jgi:hypothetical protein